MQAQMDLRTEAQQQFDHVIEAMRGHVSDETWRKTYGEMRYGAYREGDVLILIPHYMQRKREFYIDLERIYEREFEMHIAIGFRLRTEVVNVRHLGQKDYVYIGRANRAWGLDASEWANPLKLSQHKDKTREQVIDMYRDWIVKQPVYAHVRELQGRRLACWCHPQSCHGDVLAELADATLQPRAATGDGADGR